MIIKADCLLAYDDFHEVSPGHLRVEDARIVELGDDVSSESERVFDCRKLLSPDELSIIIPGLIDSHCHLELSNLRGKLHFKGSLARWLGELVVKRATRWQKRARAAKAGATESLANGTTTVADISADVRTWNGIAKTPIRKVCFAEIVGIGPKRYGAFEKLVGKVEAMPAETQMSFRGVSPHAPYSTDAEVYRQAIELAEKLSLRLTTHLAEDPAEIEFLRSCRGPWRTALERLRLWDESIRAFDGSPIEWAKQVGLLDIRAILAHVNYVDENDIDLLARGRASVAYCPAAHQYFGHPGHCYRKMIEAGINVALGNDSLACSDKLSILSQMQMVWRAGGLAAATVLAMGTTAGARALQLQELTGTLQPGRRADLVVLRVAKSTRTVIEAILEGPTEPVATMVNGTFLNLR